jgi:predicted metal-binding protein
MLIEPNNAEYGTFRNLLMGHRVTEVVMVAEQYGVFEAVGDGTISEPALADVLGWPGDMVERFIGCACDLGLLGRDDGSVWLPPFSRRFLLRSSPDYQGAALAFERDVLAPSWRTLPDALAAGGRVFRTGDKSPAEYRDALRRFLMAMDDAARVRAVELWDHMPGHADRGVILDAGAGSGAYLAEFLERNPGWSGVFCDLADVIDVARHTPRLEALGERVVYVPCNLLASPLVLPEHIGPSVDIALLSNLVHVQGKEETTGLLRRALASLSADGVAVVHDFFRDLNWQGSLYDLEMLINTHNGRTYSTGDIAMLLKECGWPSSTSFSLPSHSGVVVAATVPERLPDTDPVQRLRHVAEKMGFTAAVPTRPVDVPVREWVRQKCRYGCGEYTTCMKHRPQDIEPERMRQILSEYSSALTVVGCPPLPDFRQRLLDLEKSAFLANHHKALVFAAGPCCLCPDCEPDGCRHPDRARPALEACGVDVFELAKRGGLPLKVLKDPGAPVCYIGLLLIE